MKIVLILLLICLLGGIICISGPWLKYKVEYCRQLSSYGALETALDCSLTDYYEKNKRYPDSLDQLTVLLSDGAIKEMLDDIIYDNNELTCKYSYTRKDSIKGSYILVKCTLNEGRSFNKKTTAICNH